MKRLATTAIALAALAWHAHSASETPDTITNPGTRVVITESLRGATVEITDSMGNTTRRHLGGADGVTRTIRTENILELKSVRIGDRNRSRWTVNTGGVNIGWVSAPGHPSNLPVEMGKSWEAGWFEIIGVGFDAGPMTTIRLGIGMDWKNYKITTPDYRYATDSEGVMTGAPYPAGTSPINSRLKTFTLSMPLMVRQKMPFRLMGQQQWVAVGIAPGYSPHASIVTRWETAQGKKVKESTNKTGHRRWVCELVGMLGLSEDVGIYLRYQPMSVVRQSGAPDFRSLSTGLIFFY